jgi:RHH-type rel operon transcriptional repressor/antitoxin RelB
MATINIRIDDDLKVRSYATLERLGVTPSELLRSTLQYVADEGRLPIKTALLTEEDAELLETARKRLQSPEPVKVDLDNL